jgi:hypothetical protein
MSFPPEIFILAKHLHPDIRISPFTFINLNLHTDNFINDDVLNPKFWLDDGISIHFYQSGREALKKAIMACNVEIHDSIMIITTSGGDYISSCVTETINNICSWSSNLSKNTKAILVIHEFGFPCHVPAKLKKIRHSYN